VEQPHPQVLQFVTHERPFLQDNGSQLSCNIVSRRKNFTAKSLPLAAGFVKAVKTTAPAGPADGWPG
jgi:hypothetical protein